VPLANATESSLCWRRKPGWVLLAMRWTSSDSTARSRSTGTFDAGGTEDGGADEKVLAKRRPHEEQ
jgi:hypothetical protein